MLQCSMLFRITIFSLMLTSVAMRAEDSESQSVPFVDCGQVILVPVKAFDRTLYFIADTGCANSAIDVKYRSYLGNQMGTATAIGTLGTMYGVSFYHCPEISVGGKPLALSKIFTSDLMMLTMITGEPCDGVLGMDWFAKNVVNINFDNQTFSVGGKVFGLVRKNFVAIPLEQTNGYYASEVLVNRRNSLTLMIDTGDSSSVSLNQEDWKEVYSTNHEKTMTSIFADPIGLTTPTKVGALDQVTLAQMNYSNLHAMLIRTVGQHSRLGLGFFRRHNVVFDFGGRTLYLQPDKDFSAPDTEDMSGLHLLREGDNTVVYSVDDQSPASVQGIEANDIIEAINDQPASSLKMKAIREMLRSHDEQVVVLRLRRADHVWEVKIVLKKSL